MYLKVHVPGYFSTVHTRPTRDGHCACKWVIAVLRPLRLQQFRHHMAKLTIASLCALVAAASAAEKTCTAINADRTDKIACTREIYFVLL